jgi:site-specific recombinase XerD
MTDMKIVPLDGTVDAWQQAIYAFLAEKERRSGSRRTVDAYSRTLQRFFGTLGKMPDEVTSRDVFAFAHGRGPSGKEPAPITIGARLACISSFYRFLIRMKLTSSNPCDEIERPRALPSPPRGLSADEIRRLLAAIPDTSEGLRDKAIILTLVLTGRRRLEILNLKVGDITTAGGLFYTYRGKGGKRVKRELPRPAFEAIQSALAAWGKDLATMAANESLWPSRHPSRNGVGITDGTFYGSLKRYLVVAGLPPAGVHILRHAAAKLRREAGESVEEVSRFLDHSSLAVTTVYLRRLEGEEDRGWGKVAEALGLQQPVSDGWHR